MIAFCAKRADDRTFLIDYAHALKRDTQSPLERDRVHATARFAQALRALERSDSPPPPADDAAGAETAV